MRWAVVQFVRMAKQPARPQIAHVERRPRSPVRSSRSPERWNGQDQAGVTDGSGATPVDGVDGATPLPTNAVKSSFNLDASTSQGAAAKVALEPRANGVGSSAGADEAEKPLVGKENTATDETGTTTDEHDT